jgi:DNA-binding NarL/FixJ family response regulator
MNAHGLPATTDQAPHTLRLDDEELRILRFLAQGLPTDVVARRVGVSGRTVRRRVRGICDRSGSANLMQAVVWAVRHGLL